MSLKDLISYKARFLRFRMRTRTPSLMVMISNFFFDIFIMSYIFVEGRKVLMALNFLDLKLDSKSMVFLSLVFPSVDSRINLCFLALLLPR